MGVTIKYQAEQLKAIVQILLQHNADNNLKDVHGNTPAQLALKFGLKDIYEMLTKQQNRIQRNK